MKIQSEIPFRSIEQGVNENPAMTRFEIYCENKKGEQHKLRQFIKDYNEKVEKPEVSKEIKGQSVSDDYIIRLEQENLRDKEALKVLAEAVKDNYYESDPDGPDFCRYCDGNLSRRNVATVHKEDCPVLLAEEILNDN